MNNTERNFTKERAVIDLIQKYNNGRSITAMIETMGFSRKFYYNLVDSRIIPNRDNIITLIIELEFSQSDAITLMNSQGYIFPYTDSDQDVMDRLQTSA